MDDADFTNSDVSYAASRFEIRICDMGLIRLEHYRLTLMSQRTTASDCSTITDRFANRRSSMDNGVRGAHLPTIVAPDSITAARQLSTTHVPIESACLLNKFELPIGRGTGVGESSEIRAESEQASELSSMYGETRYRNRGISSVGSRHVFARRCRERGR